MVLLLREDDVAAVLKMPDTIDVIEKAFVALAQGKAANRQRQRIMQANGVMQIMAASIPTMGVMGHKTYTVFRDAMQFIVMLHSAQDGELLALIEAVYLGGMRTGATSALATTYLSRQDSSVVGLIGAGKQAAMQLLGVCSVRPISQVFVYSRRLYECEQFCREMTAQLNIEVRPAASPREAVENADIVITATTSPDPVFPGDWLRPGCHVNAIGSNWAGRREIDLATLQRSDLVVVESRAQALAEAGDLIIPAEAGQFDWNRVYEMASVVAGNAPRRQSAEEITLYKGLGIGLEDIATAGLVYRLAREQNRGEDFRLFS